MYGWTSFPCLSVLTFFLFLSSVLQLLWNRGRWGWTTSFRDWPQTPTPASSEYHLTHVIVLQSDKMLGNTGQKCYLSSSEETFVTQLASNISWLWCKQCSCALLGHKLNLSLFPFSPEVQSILNLNPPQDAELMNTNPSPPVSCFKCWIILLLLFTFMALKSSFSSLLQPSPSQQINLGPSSNPSAKPSDFHFLKVIGKGSFGKVLLARHRTDDEFYAVKVLQKKAILKKKEVNERTNSRKNVYGWKCSLFNPVFFVFLRRSTSCQRGMCC